jgi:hypothetical protein
MTELKDIPYGYCHCGCGNKTNIAKRTRTSLGWVHGEPFLFIKNHHNRGSWRKLHTEGRREVCVNGIRKKQYQIIVEEVLGYELLENAVIHHKDGNHHNNTLSNLVVCEDEAYHQLLHRRQKAFDTCGHANWRWCSFCKTYDDPINMYISDTNCYHRRCSQLYASKWRAHKRS